MTEIINATRYSSDDVIAIVNALLPREDDEDDWERIKIRYLAKPRTHPSKEDRWADFIQGWGKREERNIEIAILRPDKLKISPLILLAQCAEGEEDVQVAPPKVIGDLCRAIKKRQSKVKSLCIEEFLSTSPVIRILAKPDPAMRKISAYRNFEQKVQGAKNSLRYDRHALKKARELLEAAHDNYMCLFRALPAQEQRVDDLIEQLEKRRAKLSPEILAQIDGLDGDLRDQE